jgi:hypothetical protein
MSTPVTAGIVLTRVAPVIEKCSLREPQATNLQATPIVAARGERVDWKSTRSIPRTKLSPMAMGRRPQHAKQASMGVAATELPRSAAHPFYARLNQILYQHDFDGFVEGLCERFYADEGRPGLPPGRYFRLLPIGYFEGLDAERAIAWRAADSFAVREFLGLVLPEAPRAA